MKSLLIIIGVILLIWVVFGIVTSNDKQFYHSIMSVLGMICVVVCWMTPFIIGLVVLFMRGHHKEPQICRQIQYTQYHIPDTTTVDTLYNIKLPGEPDTIKPINYITLDWMK